MKIKKFRLAEAITCAFFGGVAVVAGTDELVRARSGDSGIPSEGSVPAAYLMALILLGVAFWLARDAIRRR